MTNAHQDPGNSSNGHEIIEEATVELFKTFDSDTADHILKYISKSHSFASHLLVSQARPGPVHFDPHITLETD